MFYHIKIFPKRGTEEYKIDFTEEELNLRIIKPYLYDETIVINGTTIEPKDINRIKVTETDVSLKSAIQRMTDEMESDTSAYKFLGSSPEWRAIDEGKDVTNDLINQAPGSAKRQKNPKSVKAQKNSKSVFIVHGHDIELKNDVEIFLREINLEPIVLHRELDEGLTIIEKFEKHSNVNYAIVLLTPDDIGFNAAEVKKDEEARNIEYRARQNVIFEFGYFVGKLTRSNVCCIYKENLRLPSDLDGLIYKKVDKSVQEVGMFLMKELKNAGLDVKFE